VCVQVSTPIPSHVSKCAEKTDVEWQKERVSFVNIEFLEQAHIHGTDLC